MKIDAPNDLQMQQQLNTSGTLETNDKPEPPDDNAIDNEKISVTSCKPSTSSTEENAGQNQVRIINWH